MQRLRTTFKRSRTPTGQEMKTQSSLDVPKQVRSASFDEIQLEARRLQQQQQGQSSDPTALLRVPQLDQRSRSVDSGAPSGSEESGNYLEVPITRKFQRRRSSGSRSPVCVHCLCVEEYNRQHPPQDDVPPDKDFHHSTSSVSESSSECDEDAPLPAEETVCPILVTLSPSLPSPPPQSPPPIPTSPIIEFFPADSEPEIPLTPTQTRRKSIHRQEAFFTEPTGSSLENMSEAPSEPISDGASEGGLSEGETSTAVSGLVVHDIYLQVPDLKRDRAASVDSCFSKVSEKKTEELQHSGVSLEVPVGPNVALRSRSVDIVLPTDEQARYKALAMAAPANSQYRKSVVERVLRSTPDWSESAVNGDHLWVPTSASGDFCYVGDTDCTKHGSRMKCSACNVIAHQNCIGILVDRVKFTCKPTFRDVGVRQYREQTTIQHHWAHRRSEKGKCRICGKAFQSKLSFSYKEIVAISCSWCKAAYHNKDSCFNIQRIGEECSLGVHNSIIIPPSWIVKLPRKGSFKSSLRKTPKKRTSGKKKSRDKDKEHRAFVIKPIPSANLTPVIVFINPKSGGNQGLKLLQKFQWLLNPRQVFDLNQGGPKMGLELFKKVPNLRILACGGDGTVGWILSVIDQIGMDPVPAVGVLPLGTGNDLARALGWGGGYTDEPVSKILSNINHSDTVLLDRWILTVEKNNNAEATDDGRENLPLNVVNNYYSLGVDAHIALEFHEAREAHPEKFNSRLRNKMFYGQMGGKDLIKRKWKSLADFVTLECDGQDITPKLKDLRVHAIVFLNIPSYSGGTKPWNRSMGSSEPSTEDGLIEVLGLTTYQLNLLGQPNLDTEDLRALRWEKVLDFVKRTGRLGDPTTVQAVQPLLQAGGHGTCITQCRSAKIVTSKSIPMQVDGEACKLKPSIITLNHLNQATMLAKRKDGPVIAQQTALDNLTVNVHRILMSDYEQHHYDKDLLTQAAMPIGKIDVNPIADLEQVRALINKLMQEHKEHVHGDWCFVDSCTAERFFRIDKAQENLHYIVDIACENLYILDCGGSSIPQTPEDETAAPSPSSSQQIPYNIPEMRISDEGSLDSPSDHPPMSPKVLQSPDDYPVADERIPIANINGDKETGLKIRSITERMFALNQESYRAFCNTDEKTNELLLTASKTGDLKIIKDQHSQGVSLMTKDSSGQNMLHYAARYGHRDIVKYLVNYAPNLINKKESNLGQTPLHKAAAYKQRNICCILVAAGATLNITDHRGQTAKALALQTDDHDLVAYLESQEQFQLVSSDLGTIV